MNSVIRGLFCNSNARAGATLAIDARVRLLAALAFALVVVALSSAAALGAACGMAVLALLWSRPAPGMVVKRLLAMDGMMLVVLATLPFTVPGEPLLRLWGVAASHEGLRQALAIFVRANAALMMLLALLGSMSAASLSRALSGLYLPDRLVHLLLFTVRYIDVLGKEYARLRRAMTARAFRPRTDRHTWRSLGWLAGMLMVRSFERAERVLAAMKCRGFDGRLFRPDDRPLSAVDKAFVLAGCTGIALLVGLETL